MYQHVIPWSVFETLHMRGGVEVTHLDVINRRARTIVDNAKMGIVFVMTSVTQTVSSV